MISGFALVSIFCFNELLALMISTNLCVKSSSIRCELSFLTDGLIGGGGTGNTEQSNHSGRQCNSLNPKKFASSSLIRSNKVRMYSTLTSISSTLFGSSSSMPLKYALIPSNPLNLYLSGCLQLHPSLVCCPHRVTFLDSLYISINRFFGFFCFPLLTNKLSR